mgnify:CR=1 FL=1
MSNREILQEMILKFGKRDATLFCRMEAQKYRIQWEEAKRKRIATREDLSYDVEWWESMHDKLLNK